MKRTQNYFRGCLLGCAIGDAFGEPVKLMMYDKIQEIYGENGLNELIIEERKAMITDDTQLTCFTAEGLIRSGVRAQQKHIERTKRDTGILVFRAYLRWLYTQGLRTPNWRDDAYDGWVVGIKVIHGYRDAGLTCITALGKGIMGTPYKPINQSRRCGTVIRIAPVGLFESEEDVFEVGKIIGAITHGHPEAYLASGALASLIFYIIEGFEMEEALEKVLAKLRLEEGSEACIEAIEKAIALYQEGYPSRKHLQVFGDGFMAKDALGMAVYCALHYPKDIEQGMILAINQDGNSNSVAAIYGSIVGAYMGEEAIPGRLIKHLELVKELRQIADDLLLKYDASEDFLKRYPGW